MAVVMEWLDRAACRDVEDPELFYAFDDKENRKAVRQAKAVCAGCPVRPECLEMALRNNEQGVWGGLTEQERRDLKRARRRNEAAGIQLPLVAVVRASVNPLVALAAEYSRRRGWAERDFARGEWTAPGYAAKRQAIRAWYLAERERLQQELRSDGLPQEREEGTA